MEPRFDIPHRRTMPIWRICLVMGLTALMLLLLASRMDMVMDMIQTKAFV